MRIIDEIREGFASIKVTGAREIMSLPKEYPGYVIRTPEGYGVAIKVNDNVEVNEKFNSCKFHNIEMTMDGQKNNYLILSSSFEEYRYEFASLCAEFLDSGERGENRKNLENNPYDWWAKWRELVGNTSRELCVYNVIAEMMVLAKKFSEDSTTEWTTMRSGSHDVECSNESCEVKSTIKRYGATIKITGQHQLEHSKPLFLYFCRLEESLEGVSINDLRNELIKIGYDEGKIECELDKLGFEKGANIRNKKYKVLEKRKYIVNDKFPRIVNESFKGDKLPDYIIRVEYTVDLDGIEYTEW